MPRLPDGPRPLDLRGLDLAPGEARALELPVSVDDVLIAGQRYLTDRAETLARIEVAQSASGWHFRLRVATAVVGPCWRCLAEARVDLAADIRDFAAFGRAVSSSYDEDLDCEYLDGDALDLEAMTRDALVDLLPAKILCREECAGLCPACGADLNAGTCECPAPTPDGRWGALEALAHQLRVVR